MKTGSAMMLSNLFFIITTCFLFDQCCPALGSSQEAGKVIFVADSSSIFRSQTFENGSAVFSRLPLSNVGSPYGIDVDVDAGLIFWTDASAGKIKRASIDGGEVTELTSATSTGVRGISIDPFSEEIFWTDITIDSIEMAKYDGTGRRRVLYLPSKDPRAIVVNPERRELYYSTIGRTSRYTGRRTTYQYYRGIGRVNYDGTNSRTLFLTSNSNYQPIGLAINDEGTHLYWCNRYTSSHNSQIRTSTISGATRETVLGSVPRCEGIAWFDGDIYWADSYTRYVGTVDVETDEKRTFQLSAYSPRDVFVGEIKRPDPEGWNCTFEKSLCGWQRSGNCKWQRQNGQSINSTGPQTDNTRQNDLGRYVLAKTANASQLTINVATLTSPLINASGATPKCFRFWYQMSNSIRGTLKIYFREESEAASPRLIWSKFGVHVDEWIGAEVIIQRGSVGFIDIKYIVSGDVTSSIAIDDVSFGECRSESRLVCGDTSMTVYLDRAKLGISRNDQVTLKSSVCRGEEFDSETMSITAPYGGCGTTASVDNDTFVFSNQVVVSPRSGIRSSGIDIRVNCSINRDYRVEMSYFAHSWIKFIQDEGVGNFSVGIHQYPNEKLNDPYPISSYPQQVDEGDTIYMATKMSQIKDVVRAQNSRCWATQSPNPLDPIQKDIILNGCPADGSARALTSGDPNFQPFSFKAFSFTEDMTLIYVHCDVIVCKQNGDTACNSDCSSARPKRDLRFRRDVKSGPHTVSQGPFISKATVSEAKNNLEVKSGVNIVLLLTACTCILFSAFVVVYARSKLQQRHTNQPNPLNSKM